MSFHINSGPSAAHGAEVYAPTANGSDYTQVSVELANKVMNNLAAMGLTYRGVFQMQVGDEFAVIRCAREQGIPGILIEHGFISNAAMPGIILAMKAASNLAKLTLMPSFPSSPNQHGLMARLNIKNQVKRSI